MKEIKLTQGKVALIDDNDFEWLNKYKWCAIYYKEGDSWVAKSGMYNIKLKKRIPISMHRLIMGMEYGENKSIFVDHIDHNTLNNQRSNLRFCDSYESIRNIRKHKDNTSGYKGVTFDKGKWEASIMVSYKAIYLGRFDNKIEAAKIYNEAAIKYHKEFACLNVIRERPFNCVIQEYKWKKGRGKFEYVNK